ncbi:hypothetical protein EK904_010311 [Melospiza melodia maxima]|nr:hypothetical protein EK904_010311 [Melospiza melodia maxima]
MTLRKVNISILIVAVVIFLLVIHHNFISLSDFLRRELSDPSPLGLQPIDFIPAAPQRLADERNDKEIPVVIAASDERLGGAIAAMNSIYQNTRANVVFHIVTLNDTVDHLRMWLRIPPLKNMRYRILDFDPRVLEGKVQVDPQKADNFKPLTFARFYLPSFVPHAEKVIYVDDDVIVQGDIVELYNTPLKPGHAAAFSDDCDSTSSKVAVRGAGNQVSFSLVYILSTSREELYSKTLAGSITTPPLLIVFYKQHSSIDPMWNVRHLGSSAGKRYSPQFVEAAKLLHWNGHFKPWGRTASYAEVWEKWYLPDPAGKFNLIRRHSEAYEAK